MIFSNVHRNILLMTGILFVPVCTFAVGAPVMGNSKADEHMLCGKGITVEIQHSGPNVIILGLINKKNQDLDTFMSAQPFDENGAPTRFEPVKFDTLSGQYVRQENNTLDIVWGKENVNDSKAVWYLTLGSHQYECGTLVRWPDESADQIYGETTEEN